MSKRGGSSRTATTGVRAIANVLGIARHEIGSYTQVRKEPLELYPPLSRQPLTLETSHELEYMTELKQELLHRFHDSAFYHQKTGKRDVRRYTDKYRALNKDAFETDWSRIPRELNWRSDRIAKLGAKRRRMDDEAMAKKLEKLAQKESELPNEDDLNEKDESEKDEEDENKNNEDNNEGEPLSDDDYLEEDNDYVQNYFDNGDAYAEGSDDNFDDGY